MGMTKVTYIGPYIILPKDELLIPNSPSYLKYNDSKGTLSGKLNIDVEKYFDVDDLWGEDMKDGIRNFEGSSENIFLGNLKNEGYPDYSQRESLEVDVYNEVFIEDEIDKFATQYKRWLDILENRFSEVKVTWGVVIHWI